MGFQNHANSRRECEPDPKNAMRAACLPALADPFPQAQRPWLARALRRGRQALLAVPAYRTGRCPSAHPGFCGTAVGGIRYCAALLRYTGSDLPHERQPWGNRADPNYQEAADLDGSRLCIVLWVRGALRISVPDSSPGRLDRWRPALASLADGDHDPPAAWSGQPAAWQPAWSIHP
jgi:hypothetical protein